MDSCHSFLIFIFINAFFFFSLSCNSNILYLSSHSSVGGCRERTIETGYSEQLTMKPALLLHPSISVNEPLFQLCYIKHRMQHAKRGSFKSTRSSKSASRTKYEPVVFTATLLTETNHSAIPCKLFSMKMGTEKKRRCYFLL